MLRSTVSLSLSLRLTPQARQLRGKRNGTTGTRCSGGMAADDQRAATRQPAPASTTASLARRLWPDAAAAVAQPQQHPSNTHHLIQFTHTASFVCVSQFLCLVCISLLSLSFCQHLSVSAQTAQFTAKPAHSNGLYSIVGCTQTETDRNDYDLIHEFRRYGIGV